MAEQEDVRLQLCGERIDESRIGLHVEVHMWTKHTARTQNVIQHLRMCAMQRAGEFRLFQDVGAHVIEPRGRAFRVAAAADAFEKPHGMAGLLMTTTSPTLSAIGSEPSMKAPRTAVPL